MPVSNRDLAMTLANEISSRIGRGRHKAQSPAELDDLIADCRTLKGLIGGDYWETIGSLIDHLRKLKVDPNNQDLIRATLDVADGVKALATRARY